MTSPGKKVGIFFPGLYLQDNLMKLVQNFRSFRTPYETSKNGVFCRNFDFRPPILPSTFSRKYFFGAKNSQIPVLQRWDNTKTLQIESSYTKVTRPDGCKNIPDLCLILRKRQKNEMYTTSWCFDIFGLFQTSDSSYLGERPLKS